MEKNKKTIIPLIIMIIVILIGCFFLPEINGTVNELQSQNRTDKYELGQVQYDNISGSALIGERLNFFTKNNYIISVDENEAMDKDEAYNNVLRIMEFLKGKNNVLDNNFSLKKSRIHPVAVSNKQDSKTAIYWLCEFDSDDNNSFGNMAFDHETGKLISFQFYRNIYSVDEDIEITYSDSKYLEQSSDWADACLNYYGFNSYEIKPRGRMGNTFSYDIVFDYDYGKKITLSYGIDMDFGLTYFNLDQR